jgi:hypothetical protein
MSQRPFDTQRAEANVRRRHLADGLNGLIFRAAHGDTKDLCRYLESDEPLSAKAREGLSWLIGKLESQPRGRPSGTHGRRAAIVCAVTMVAIWKEDWRDRNGRARVPKVVGKVFNVAAAERVKRKLKCNITAEDIRLAINAGRPAKDLMLLREEFELRDLQVPELPPE